MLTHCGEAVAKQPGNRMIQEGAYAPGPEAKRGSEAGVGVDRFDEEATTQPSSCPIDDLSTGRDVDNLEAEPVQAPVEFFLYLQDGGRIPQRAPDDAALAMIRMPLRVMSG